MQCNCENLHCPVCQGKGCKEQAGARRAMYVGAMCDGCAQHMPRQYMVTETSPGVYEDGTNTGHVPTQACNSYLGDILRAGSQLEGNPRCFCIREEG